MSHRITLRFTGEDRSIHIECMEGESLLEAMRRQEVPYRAECGGRGTCGKCRVRVFSGILKAAAQDMKCFSEAELKQGLRLSCKAYPKEDCTVELFFGYETAGFDVVTKLTGKPQSEKGRPPIPGNPSYLVAIDLGTTTLAFSLVEEAGCKVIRTHTAANPQRAYGADVITRIKSSAEGKQEALKSVIREEILRGILTLTKLEGIEADKIKRIAIAGNTTMGHLFMGYRCDGLGVYPFTPVEIGAIRKRMNEVFPVPYKTPLVLLPGISAFVGGDITAGLLACGFDRSEELCLLVDLGTNGEMALGSRRSILVTSAAAGPAFEGGNISCGVGSIPGAISHVTLEEGGYRYETIAGKPPIGVCGTGVIEIASELLRSGRMDETGLLADPYFEEGFEIGGMKLLQRDIRELQLAKAAVRAGIEILIKRSGISYGDIDKVCLAGGFGYKLDVEKAIHIGLLPKQLAGKVEAVGNSSLSGAIRYLTEEDCKERVDRILSVAKEIHLSNDPGFNDKYIQSMSF